jgi:hypothetical protein
VPAGWTTTYGKKESKNDQFRIYTIILPWVMKNEIIVSRRYLARKVDHIREVFWCQLRVTRGAAFPEAFLVLHVAVVAS